jgi:hypothetical protein
MTSKEISVDPEGPVWTALAAILLEALGRKVAERGVPTWIRVQDPSDGTEGDFYLEFFEDSRGFLGWTAPPECQAVGVVACGRAIAEDGPVEPPPGFTPGATTRVRAACLVARDGAIGWQMETLDGACHPAPPTEGRLMDCFRRCFGLPTPAAAVGPGNFQALLWLISIEEVLQGSNRRLTWNQMLDLHPAANPQDYRQLANPHGPPCAPTGRWGEPEWTWEALRRSAIRDNWARGLVQQDLAAWMDEGMFARWILDSLPSPEDVLAKLRPRLSTSAARRLAHAVREA